MSLFWEIGQIKSQIVDTERLLEMVNNHPVMSIGLRKKLEFLKEKLSVFPIGITEPKLRLLFSGNAVKGSLGIKSKFVGRTVKPIQELIKTQTALVRFGEVGKRGQAKRSANSELYLTALPTGSFGIELSQLETNDLFDEQDVSEAIQQVINLIGSATDSNESFENAIENTPKRNIGNLKAFLKVIAEEKSILKIESGSTHLNLSEQKVHEAFERVSLTESIDDELFIEGILRGFLLDSGKFEIINNEGDALTGFINPELSEEQLFQYDRLFLNQSCRIHLIVNKTTFISGKEKTSYELIEINPL